MAGRPKTQRLLRTLKQLACEELGDGAEPIDFVIYQVSMGRSLTALAHEVTECMGEPVSRSWLSWRVNRLTPMAKVRIADARQRATRRRTAGAATQTTETPGPRGQGRSNRSDDCAAAGKNNNRRTRGTIPASE